MNQRTEEALIEKIRDLPDERKAQVEDFVNFLAMQESRKQASVRLQAMRKRLPSEEITEAEMLEIAATVKEVRAVNRAERERSGRP